MKMKSNQRILFNLINLLTFTQSLAQSVGNCGILQEKFLYNETTHVAAQEYPWTAMIAFRNNVEDDLEYRCQGVLLSKRIVITTNYCLQKLNGAFTEVLLGNGTTAVETYNVDEIIMHPSFNRQAVLFNIGLLHLERDVVFGPFVSPICLPPADLTNSGINNKRLYITGMFKVDHSKRKSVVHIRNRYCQNRGFIFHNQHHICGYITNPFGTFFSGAGLMDYKCIGSMPTYFYLVGLNSFNNQDDAGFYGFSSIVPVLPWIKNNIELA